jgi:uncharacterized protein (TIGR03435 family)
MPLQARIVLGLLSSYGLVAQTAPPSRAFEVASVKVYPASQGAPNGFSFTPQRSGGRLSWTTNMPLLLSSAFHLPGWRITGAADKDQSFYSIEAGMDVSATEDKVRQMLRKLLADRFGLVTHRETRTVDSYRLVVAKNGPKINNSADGEAQAMPDYLKGKPAEAFEGRVFVSMEGIGVSAITARGISITRLTDQLADTLRTPVEDHTGLTGRYYFGFRFVNLNGSPADDPDVPTLFDAIQNQLGLRLDKQKAPTEFLVVDRVDKPSAN